MDPIKVDKKVRETCRRIVTEEEAISAEEIGEATGQNPEGVATSLADGSETPLSLLTTLAVANINPEPVMAAAHEIGYFLVKHPPNRADIRKYDEIFLSCVSNFNKLSATMRKSLDTGEVTPEAAKKIAKEAADVLLVAGSVYTLAKKTASGG